MDNRRNVNQHTALKNLAGRQYTIANAIFLSDRALGRGAGTQRGFADILW